MPQSEPEDEIDTTGFDEYVDVPKYTSECPHCHQYTLSSHEDGAECPCGYTSFVIGDDYDRIIGHRETFPDGTSREVITRHYEDY